MSVFFISDLHLGHDSVLKWRFKEDGSVYDSVEEHDELLIDNWNHTVGKRDVVWVLGDVAFNDRGLRSLSRLVGIKHLVLGNHDRYLRTNHIKTFNKISGMVAYKNKYVLTHAPLHPRSVRPRFEYNIHGHTHAQPSYGEEYRNVSVENIGGIPRTLEYILNMEG